MIADIVIIAIMALCTFLGYKRGLIGVSVRILGFIISLVVALILYIPISNYIIDNTEAVSSLQQVIQSKLYKDDTEQIEEDNNENRDFASEIEKYIKDSTDEIKANSTAYISEQIAIVVVRGATWFGLFIAVRIIMIFIKILGKVIEKIPIIKQFNKARRNNIWHFRRICSYICSSCHYKLNCTYDK